MWFSRPREPVSVSDVTTPPTKRPWRTSSIMALLGRPRARMYMETNRDVAGSQPRNTQPSGRHSDSSAYPVRMKSTPAAAAARLAGWSPGTRVSQARLSVCRRSCTEGRSMSAAIWLNWVGESSGGQCVAGWTCVSQKATTTASWINFTTGLPLCPVTVCSDTASRCRSSLTTCARPLGAARLTHGSRTETPGAGGD